MYIALDISEAMLREDFSNICMIYPFSIITDEVALVRGVIKRLFEINIT